ncbi:TetR/AcrR family transcriptional regulator [Pseudomonas sp. LS1212]|uniref:TetR/AcrR family transcriptional regulator n=1 Tax=Pseudomonas sp. LS1212 TaxID=2972478 RepID=UPI00215C41AD|nr:TetR/AcrR family transcriptional regulator [Pseudomonas sp. LS1212]UVJ46098.1 TetR/AcrR family transcriptional regulator [Pseudomonas sp. LS1212]
MTNPAQCSRYEESRDKALELFALKGFGQVSMRELAAHLGLTAGSLYHHFPSKQHLLFDLIEELHEELLATLTLGSKRLRATENPLGVLIRAHWNLHRERPLQFRLAERDLCCLTDTQQQQIINLREQYERQLLQLIAPHTTLGGMQLKAAGHAIANLVNHLPGWLEDCPLPDSQRLALMENLVVGAIERTLLACGISSAA